VYLVNVSPYLSLLIFDAKINSISSFAPQLHFVDSHSQGDKRTGFTFEIKPDISVYHNTLGGAIPAGCDSSLLDMHIEFKMYNFENPFTCPPSNNQDQVAFIGRTDNQQDTLGQIGTYAAAQLISQFRTHCFSLFILHDTARIIRWDREGAVVTEPIPYNTNSGLVEFFSRYSQAPPELRGIDTTISIAPSDEATRARKALGLSGNPPMFKTTIPGNRDGPSLTVIFPRPEGRPSSPACRGTCTCRTYDLLGDHVVYLKESWRVDATNIVSEGEIYADLNAKGVEVARAPGVNRRRSAHKTATHISVDLVIVLFRVDVTCHTSCVTVTRHNVCCI